jgi:hypothetical protein
MVSHMPGASRQLQIQVAMEIIVESAALYSITALVYTVMISHLTASAATRYLYASIFFSYMAVESHHSYLAILIP